MEALLSVLRHWRQRDALPDEDLIALARKRDESAVRALIKRHNRRLFRIARGVVRNDNEAEDIVQETYVRAFTGLDRFRGESAFSTWLTRIALNEAYGRMRRRRPTVDVSQIEDSEHADGGQVIMFPLSSGEASPESEAGREQVRQILERAVDKLPEPFRMAFILRDIEGFDTDATAEFLAIRPETVKTRLFRARRLMRAEIEKALSPDFSDMFPFAGERCLRMADRVIERLQGVSR